MLSRAVSIDDVLILRDFDKSVLNAPSDLPFLEYEHFLEERAKETAIRFRQEQERLAKEG